MLDKNGVRIMFHFAKNSPHPCVAVIVVTIMNFTADTLNAVSFQAALPKVCGCVGEGG